MRYLFENDFWLCRIRRALVIWMHGCFLIYPWIFVLFFFQHCIFCQMYYSTLYYLVTPWVMKAIKSLEGVSLVFAAVWPCALFLEILCDPLTTPTGMVVFLFLTLGRDTARHYWCASLLHGGVVRLHTVGVLILLLETGENEAKSLWLRGHLCWFHSTEKFWFTWPKEKLTLWFEFHLRKQLIIHLRE